MEDGKLEGQNTPFGSDRAPRNRTPWNTVGGRVICLVSRKGGVGKTTSAVNLGAALALSGHTVLVVGTDPQCGVCRTLGVPPLELPSSLNEIFTDALGNAGRDLAELALPSSLDNLHFVSPRVITLADEEEYLTNLTRHAEDFVREIDRARNLYDTILIDCPPSMGPATRAALMASDSYLVPVQAEELCRESVASLLDFVDTFKDRTYPGLEKTPPATERPTPLALEGLFLTMASTRTRMGRHVAARISEDFGDLVFASDVPRTTRLSEMALRGKPAVIYDRRSPGSRAYFDLADELVARFASGVGGSGSLIDAMIESMGRSLAPDKTSENLTRPEDSPDLPEQSATQPRQTYAAPRIQSDELRSPEMVSLDDLLAEEENRSDTTQTGDEDWEEGYWSGDSGERDRLN